MLRDLIPTVVTNKNGVVTTVYRKPSKGLKSATLAPVVSNEFKELYDLKKRLMERIEDLDNGGYERWWREKIVNDAYDAKDTMELKRFDRNFNVTRDVYRDVSEAIELAGLDSSDDLLFDTVSSFMMLSPRAHGTERFAEFVPLLASNPELVQEVAHYRNVVSGFSFDHVPRIDEVTALMEKEERTSSHLPAFLASTVKLSATPVDDYRLVAKAIANHSEWHAYTYFGSWDRQTVTFLADVVRNDNIEPLLLKRIKDSGMSPRLAAEYLSVLRGTNDLISSNEDYNSARVFGPNGIHITLALTALKRFDTSGHDLPPINTEGDLANACAQMRLILTMEDNYLVQDDELNLSEGVVELLRDHSSTEEVDAIVRLFNERGTVDTELARDHLANMHTAPLSKGWL